MKQMYTFLLAVLITVSATAQTRPVNIVTTWWDNWSKVSSWSLGRLPLDGDSIVIPAGKGIVLNEDYSYKNVVITVLGNLTIKKKLKLDKQSSINITAAGQINAFGANRKDEIIELNNVIKFDEKSVATITGAAFANTSTGVSPNGFSINNSLPVTFKSFYAVKNNNHVVLTWSTAQEFNNNNFEVQKSFNGSDWTVIAIIMGAGNSATEKNYSFTDKDVQASTVFYRIRQVDIDGKYAFTTVKSIKANGSTATAKIYAYGKNINVEFNTAVKNDITVRLVSLSGQVMMQKNFQQASYKISLDNVTVNTGIYLVQVSDGNNWMATGKVML